MPFMDKLDVRHLYVSEGIDPFLLNHKYETREWPFKCLEFVL